jgi:hypothetical protein
MPAGIPGMLNRTEIATVEPQITMSTNPPTSYGVPVALDATAGQIRPIGAGDTAASVYGFLVRPWPTNGNQINEPIGTSTPATSGVCNVMRRGYMTIKLGGTTAAAKNGTLYARIANASGGKPIGGVEAASDTTNTVTLTNAYFMGPADASGNVEIAFNI